MCAASGLLPIEISGDPFNTTIVARPLPGAA
jgi:hypothetical protein